MSRWHNLLFNNQTLVHVANSNDIEVLKAGRQVTRSHLVCVCGVVCVRVCVLQRLMTRQASINLLEQHAVTEIPSQCSKNNFTEG